MTPHTPAASPATKKFLTIHGRQVAYIDQGKGFPVLLGHSYLWDSEMWRPQI
jgi:hypothetical protein